MEISEINSSKSLSHIEAIASMDNWDSFMDFIQDQCSTYIKDSSKSYGVVLAAEELISNIIRASESNPAVSKSVILSLYSELRTTESGTFFDLITQDTGIHFDPNFENLAVNVDSPIEHREIGGLGLFLVKSSVDIVSYEWKDEHNIYTLSTTL
jgi:anti-sigma regulatory factor (Ser/Thr protein kinase)